VKYAVSHYQGNDLRKPSGGLRGKHRDKRKYELGGPPTMTKLGEEEGRRVDRTYGGNFKVRLRVASYINVATKDGTVKRAKILDIVETPENPQYARFKIISKGSIVKTSIGLVKVTSRPGQDGVLNGILIEGT